MTDNIDLLTSHTVSQKAFSGIVWNFLAYALGKGGVLLTLAIVARLLSKDDMGLMSISVVAMNYLAFFKDLGLGVALIQRRNNVEEAANTVFTINLLLGLVLSLIVQPAAPFIALYFKNPMITPVLRWLGVSFFIQALGAVHVVWLMRDLDYRRKFVPDMGSAVIKGVVSIGMAYAGYGVWALVCGQIGGALTSVILVWVVVKWRPRLRFNRVEAGSLLKFGASVTGIDIITLFTDNLDYVIVGRMFGLAQLSVYTLAYRLPEMLLISNLWVMGGVLFPAFSSIQDNLGELRKGFLASVRLVELIALPMCVGLFITADPIIRILFGEQWLDAIPVMRILAVYSWLYSVGYHVGGVYKAIGRPDILLKLSVLSLFIIFPSLLIGSRFGLIGIAWGLTISILLRRVISLGAATRLINISLPEIFSELSTSLLGSLIMALVALSVLKLASDFSPLLILVFVSLFGAATYLGVLWWVERENLLGLLRMVGIMKKQPAIEE